MAVKPGYKQTPEHVRKRVSARLETLRSKPKPVSREWLRTEYWTKRRSCVDIATEVGRDPKTVWAWMKHYGIPTRPRGHKTDHLPRGRAPGFKLSAEQRQALREARMSDGRVPYLSNGEHWLKGRPQEDHPSWKGGVTPERQAFYATDEWKAACVAVWHRADARCERCQQHHSEVRDEMRFHVHHIVSFAVRELRADVDNLALLCEHCHHFVHSKANTNRDFLGGQ